MKTFVVGQTKAGIILTIEDDAKFTFESIVMDYREAAGLFHELDRALKHPAFAKRDPKSKKEEVRYGESSHLRSVE